MPDQAWRKSRVEFKLRLRERLRRKLEQAAKRNACSMNAEILARIAKPPQKLSRSIIAQIVATAIKEAQNARTGRATR